MYNDIYQVQQAILQHLNKGKTAGSFNAFTIAPYAGEFADITKMRNIPPGVLVRLVQGPAAGENPREHFFYLFVVTKSDSFDLLLSQNNNLQLSAALGKYLDDNNVMEYYETPAPTPEVPEPEPALIADYKIDRERLTSRIFLQDDQFTIVIMELYCSILL